ncbi:signal peptidase I [Caloramator sp. E03]|uniref:signal peptidase I n=1 Tax=Caloramator sp. E03 TaxID=2576307 RepID=UPI001110DDBA|nr:signal peptidase I [Caloramator sp. E03]QCX33483.1 signal peptidase I [Caloramator sp. E03]
MGEKFICKIRENNKKIYLLMILILFIMLFVEKNPFNKAVNTTIYVYIIKPVLWAFIGLIVYIVPRKKVLCKIRLRNNLIWWICYLAFMKIALFIFAGLIDGFGKSPYNLTVKGIIINIIMVFSCLIGKESLRAYIVNGLKGNRQIIIIFITTIVMTLMDLPLNMIKGIHSMYAIMQYILKYVLASLSENIFATYIVYLGGASFSIIYFSVIRAFEWLSPILPDLRLITKSFIDTLYPIISLMIIQYIYLFEDKKEMRRNYKKENLKAWIIMSITSILSVWFVLGVFPVRPVVIATGSMKPSINPGDVIIVKKVNAKDLKIGQILEYRKDNISIFHRIIELKVDGNEIKYVTKGDNNKDADDKLISSKEIKGIVIAVIPKIGLPVLMLKAKDNELKYAFN